MLDLPTTTVKGTRLVELCEHNALVEKKELIVLFTGIIYACERKMRIIFNSDCVRKKTNWKR